MKRDPFIDQLQGNGLVFGGVYSGRRVLVTGHTGFKGSWLALWLRTLGAEVCGLSLPPEGEHSHYNLLKLRMREALVDVRDADAVRKAVQGFEPEIVFHLAAQPLVRRGYRDPMLTWGTNIMGLVHVLEAVRATPSVKVVVNVTSDKCYEQGNLRMPFCEGDPLGGHDPYSASKACAEILSASYRSSYFEPKGERPLSLATARAGNVIGGGDWGEERLVPDLVRAVRSNTTTALRNPDATRPWQHVLEPLSGYLRLAQRHWQNPGWPGEAWNFGPEMESHISVGELVMRMNERWPVLRYDMAHGPQPHEAKWLALDCRKAKAHLGWAPVWDIETTIVRTAQWYRRHHQHGEVCSLEDLEQYMQDAAIAQAVWAAS